MMVEETVLWVCLVDRLVNEYGVEWKCRVSGLANVDELVGVELV